MNPKRSRKRLSAPGPSVDTSNLLALQNDLLVLGNRLIENGLRLQEALVRFKDRGEPIVLTDEELLKDYEYDWPLVPDNFLVNNVVGSDNVDRSLSSVPECFFLETTDALGKRKKTKNDGKIETNKIKRTKRATPNRPFCFRLQRLLRAVKWVSTTDFIITRAMIEATNTDLKGPVNSMNKRMRQCGFCMVDKVGDEMTWRHPGLTKSNWEKQTVMLFALSSSHDLAPIPCIRIFLDLCIIS